MAQEFELQQAKTEICNTEHPELKPIPDDVGAGGVMSHPGRDDAYDRERRLIRIGVITLAVLFVLQVTLNISLRLALRSNCESAVAADLYQILQSQQSATQVCSCCNNLLRKLLTKYGGEKELKLLENMSFQDNDTIAGSGSLDEFSGDFF
ncbi:hypothetical protein JOB18_027956 [Solea senegalensis]|uniref:Uncharacterized protein n=1 Tax=Solea senegalensis TaxID=28829 RepID=A0AAV6QPU3_SOLSE|nr:hypothetical protein JOB18_027956 [Solea senegalensis]